MFVKRKNGRLDVVGFIDTEGEIRHLQKSTTRSNRTITAFDVIDDAGAI